ncbi:MAG: RNA-guided endonuclease IscB [Rivularia sp. ALOHA_DT_140]|nr:RNA-guided endonuclease IscB [Rivularia sp. ALOHA_DT_140]
MQSNQPNKVFLIDTNKQPLNPITPKQARNLLEKGKVAVFRQFPFTLILKKAVENPLIYPLTLKIDPGSKNTGIAILSGDLVIWVGQIEHRGQQIKDSLEKRRGIRRNRRNRKTRYRPARYDNREREEGWLPPSLMHRVQTTQTWVKRLIKFSPIQEIWIESVKFDTQLMQDSEVKSVEYQQGELQGYEVREYLLEKWGRKCAYCGKQHVPLQVEHIEPKSKGGSNRVSNLTIACEDCNQKKGDKPVEEFLKNKPEVLAKIKKQQKTPLKDAAAVNSTRKKLVEVLSELLPVKTYSGAQTKKNRIEQDLPKVHHVDAAVVGDVNKLTFIATQPLLIKCAGINNRQYIIPSKYGFARGHRPQEKTIKGFQTGDIVKAIVTKGKKIGEYLGKVAVRTTGSFSIHTSKETVQGINLKYCQIIHSKDGYNYSF